MSGDPILFTPRSLAGWAAGGHGSDLLVNHCPTFDTWAPRSIGAARQWHADDYGLAVLAELDPWHSPAIRQAIADGTLTGLSIGLSRSEVTDWWESPDGSPIPEVPAGAGIPELSVVDQPGCPGARIIATGSTALQLWEARDMLAYHVQREWPAARLAQPSRDMSRDRHASGRERKQRGAG